MNPPTLVEGLRYTITFINITATLQQRPDREQFSRYEPNLNEWVSPNGFLNLGPAYLSPQFMKALRVGDRTIGLP